MVVMKDGRRQAFDRLKLLSGLRKACEKRPISQETLDGILDDLQRELEQAYDKEFPSAAIGELVMKKLYLLDEVAYVRFASVYRQFKDVQAFSTELKRFMTRFDDKKD
jgi:transcriptional repressor NrdR